MQQILDMKINQKKKEVKKNFKVNPPQSYRPNIEKDINNLSELIENN